MHRIRRHPLAGLAVLVPGRFLLGTLVLAALVLPGAAATAEPLSPRNANYTIDVNLDPDSRTLAGHAVVEWRNIQDQPTDELWFHLYWNAWRNNRSSWMLQNRLSTRRDRKKDAADDDWSYVEVDAVRLLDRATGEAPASEGHPAVVDLTPTMTYVAPDDGNPDDRTVMRVRLPRPVAPGESVDVELEWRSKIPRTFARTGHRGDFFFIAQWFPKLAVFDPEGWNCHQFWAMTEFYSDYGSYDVTMTVPRAYVLGATGREVERRDNDDGTVSHHYRQDDVHDFVWTTSPDYRVRESRFDVAGLPPVDLRLLYQPEHEGQVERHLAAARVALESYGRWYGAYPYPQITIVDPAFESGASGMEYPTLFTAGTRTINPPGGGAPEGVTIHEAGHQFWYGLVGNNEFEYAWLDEGFNTFSTARAYDAAYGDRRWDERYFKPPGTRYDGFFVHLFDDVHLSRAVYGNRLDRFLADDAETADPQSTPTYRYFPPTSADLSYARTAQWLATLENYLGWETLQKILSTYFERYRFRHPRPEDFFAVADEVSGQDLGWYFDQVHRRTIRFDYSIDSVASLPLEWKGFSNDEKPVVAFGDGHGDRYRNEVVVRRLGEGIFPVDVLMVFADGQEIRRHWDGKDRWTMFVEESTAKLDYAVVDPERALLLDLRYVNNSKKREPRPFAASAKWSSRWMIWLQDLLAGFTFFV